MTAAETEEASPADIAYDLGYVDAIDGRPSMHQLIAPGRATYGDELVAYLRGYEFGTAELARPEKPGWAAWQETPMEHPPEPRDPWWYWVGVQLSRIWTAARAAVR